MTSPGEKAGRGENGSERTSASTGSKGEASTGSKGQKRERTRSALLRAARELVREKGYERTTLRDVAQKAGMTTGAIYGNFSSRDELFLALAEEYWGPLDVEFSAESSFQEKMRAWAEAAIDAVPERSEAAVGMLTGRAYALKNDALRERAARITSDAYEAGAHWLRRACAEDELNLSPDALVRVLHVLTDALILQRIMTPALVPDEVFFAAFGLLAKACPEKSASKHAPPHM